MGDKIILPVRIQVPAASQSPALRLTQTENISIYESLGMENMKFKKLALKEL